MSDKKFVVIISSVLKDKQLIEQCADSIGWLCRYYSSVTEALPHLSDKSIEKIFVDFNAITDSTYDLPRLDVCVNSYAQIILCFKQAQKTTITNPNTKMISESFGITLFLREMIANKPNAVEKTETLVTKVEAILGNSAVAKEARRFCEKYEHGLAPLLLCGNSGIGKRFVAKLIHQLDGNVKTFEEISLLDLKNLYDWENINFLQVIEVLKDRALQKKNLFLYIKNFDLLDKSNQIRFLERFEKYYYKEFINRQIRVVFAISNIQPDPQVYDYFYKSLVGGVLVMPDLQETKRDIVLLFESFLKLYFQGEPLPSISAEVYTILENYRWPGNIRELKQVAAHVNINYHGGIIKPNDLPEYLQVKAFFVSHTNMFEDGPRPLEAFEAYYIIEILKSVNGNISKAARQLGVTRNTIKSKLKKAGALVTETYTPLKLSV